MAGHFLSEEPTDNANAEPGTGGHFLSEGEPPQVDPVAQATPASNAAAADNSWFAPEFRSGALFKDVVAPVSAAARATYQALFPVGPPSEEAKRLAGQSFLPGELAPEQGGPEIPQYIQQAARETLTPGLIPKETMPMYWAGKEANLVARILNPQGPPAARAIRTGLEAIGGFEEKGAEAISGMTTPLNVGLALAPELLPLRAASVANKALAAYFLYEAFKATPGQWERYQAAKSTQEKAGIVAETLVSYAPAATFLHQSRLAAAARTARAEEPTTEPVGTGEAASTAPGLTKDEFRSWAEDRLNQLTQAEGELTPIQAAEAKDLQEGLAEGGDINALAVKQGIELSDVTPAPAEGEAAAAPATEPAPAAPAADAGTARFRGVGAEEMNRADFIRGLKAQREELNAKSPLTDEDIVDITDIDNALEAAGNGQLARLDKLAWEKYGVKLTGGGEESAVKPSDEKVEAPPAAQREQEGAPGPEPTTGDSDNVVGETKGEEPGGPVPPETPAAEPPVKELTPAQYKQLNRKAKAGHALTEEERAQVLAYEAKPPAIPGPLEDALAAAEQSAAEGDHGAAAINLAEAKRLLKETKRLPRDVKNAVLARVAKVQNVVGKETALPPPSTAETAEPNVVRYDGKNYYRGGYDENLKVGIWYKDRPAERGGRKVGNSGTMTALDNIWEARKAIAETAKEEAAGAKEKKAAPEKKSTAASVPTTGEAPSREEIGKGEAQPAPPPGTKVKHWTWGEGEVVGPGKKPGHTLIKFKDGSEYQFDNKVIPDLIRRSEAPKVEAPKVKPKPDPADELRDRILETKNALADARRQKRPGKELVALERSIRKDQVALNKLLNKAKSVPKPKPTPGEIDALSEREIQDRETMRKALGDRVKKESKNFLKKDVLVPSNTGGEGKLIPALTYRGLQIHKEGANYKPWRVTHEGSGKLLGHFDSEADAKAFAVRIHEGTNFDFTRPWDEVLKQKKAFGTGRFAELVSDPYGFLADAGTRLRTRANKIGAYIDLSGGPDLQLLTDAREFGSRLYQRGMAFRDWAVNMVKHLGEKIVGHLRDIWDSVTGRNILPHARERGGASPGGGGFKAQAGQLRKDFASRAEADQFIKANKSGWDSHQVIEQPGRTPPVSLIYRPKAAAPAPGSGAAQPKPIVTKSGAIIQPKYNPSAANAPPVVNSGSGSTTKPPPPGSALGPTPPRSNPPAQWANRSIADWRKAWEWIWPGSYASFKLEPNSPVINTHQRWLAGPIRFLFGFTREPWYKSIRSLTREQIVDAEHLAVTRYRDLISQGQGSLQAFLNSIKGNPLREYFVHRMKMQLLEKKAAADLNVKMPGFLDDPYLPRLTTRENQVLVRIGGGREGVVAQLKKSLGSFDKSRTYDTMKDGIVNSVEYREPIEAIIQRERVGQQLIATAGALKDLQDGGVIYRDVKDALANSKDKFPVKMEGFGGDDWWIRNRQEARFIDQNLNNSGPKSPWGTLQAIINNYARNPNLWNPMPHITKNMAFKYVLARINNFTLARDTAEFTNATNAELLARFRKVFTMPEYTDPVTGKTTAISTRMPEIVAGEKPQNWFQKVTGMALKINSPSQKFIFEKADPAMRYSLWKSYIRKGMDDQTAANHVFFDLIRYDENSGGLNFWKSVPFNFFSTWRTGTYTTMYKALTTHPIRTLLFFGAVEYMREMIYRHNGLWTHLPIDYLDAPLGSVVESLFKAKRETALGKSAPLAYGGAALNAGSVAASAALFGPGGGQAPTTISDLMQLVQGDPAALSRATNMFWGISQLFNIPGEFTAWQRDKDPSHLVNILTEAAFGTHYAIKYEPRRLGKYIPEWLPGMAYSPEQQLYAQARLKREGIATKAAVTYEMHHEPLRGVTRQGPKEQQAEDLLKGAGIIRAKRQPGAAPSGYPRGNR